MDKKAKLLEIIKDIQEMYPELDSLIIDDVDNPSSIIIASEDKMRATAEAEGIDLDVTYVDDYGEEITEEEANELENMLLEYFAYDKDKDKGPLQ